MTDKEVTCGQTSQLSPDMTDKVGDGMRAGWQGTRVDTWMVLLVSTGSPLPVGKAFLALGDGC